MTMAQVVRIGQAYFETGDQEQAASRPGQRSWLRRRGLIGLSCHLLGDIGAVDIREKARPCEPAASARDLIDRYR